MDYEIIENFLDKEQFLKIQEEIMSTEGYFPWFFRNNMTNNDNYYFRHMFYGSYVPMSKGFDSIAKPILKKFGC